MEELIRYLTQQNITFTYKSDSLIYIGDESYELILPTDGKLFDSNFHLITESTKCDHFIFSFGGQWYHTPQGSENKPQLNRVRFLGKASASIPTPSFLGIRGGYEILNGLGHYIEWVQKAQFFDTKILGICEKNTLAGTLKFQTICNENGIRLIIGATYSVYRKDEDYKYDVKCYVKNETGWINLLLMNKEVNVINNKFIDEKRFFELTEGLFIVLDPKSLDYSKVPFLDFMEDLDEVDVFYQLDSVEYDQNDRDKEYLLNLKKFVDSKFKPISITDAFYLNREDSYLKTEVNKISGVFEYAASNQFFKSKEEYFIELDSVFKNDGRLIPFFQQAIANEVRLVEECKFKIPQGGKYLPKYKMTRIEEKLYGTNENLFWALIAKGLKEKVPVHKHEEYLARIDKEVEVIELGDFIDYFLILWDIIRWSNEHGILTGIGRGSAGGCLVAYCLNITRLDPIEFGLLFERFLNRGRVEGGSLPDIDCDFAGNRRDEVKHYMEERYGVHQVFSVGTYNTLKLKSAIKDLAKLHNLDIQSTNYITSIVDDDFDGRFSGTDVTMIFRSACQTKQIMSFIQQNSELVNDMTFVLNLPKTQSIHACATIILPDEKDVFHWVPVKSMSAKDGTSCLVSEWEGGDLESIGLLKEDILGIQQLDKFQFIVELIKKNQGEDVDIYNLEYDDEVVYKYFRKGWTRDVFHFGAKGLTSYCKQSKPERMSDLIAAISLYRPGPIESNLHNEYTLRKEGQKEVEYLWGTKEITKDTYGILIYQEQIMKVCVDVGGFTLIEADEIRKALGKMKMKYSDPYKVPFIKNAVAKGCPQAEAEEIWRVMERFALYGFNASHAAAYSITGYICQYLKVHYPLEFWTSAFEYIDEAKREERTSDFISEINKTGSIKISPADINHSEITVQSNYTTNSIYWSLSSVKQVGGVAIEQIMSERDKNGPYFSFDEFIERHSFKGSKINKSHYENLIYAGAFDKIENLKSSIERIKLLQYYREKKKVLIDKTKDEFTLAGHDVYEEWWWDLQQKRLSGVAFFDYALMVEQYLKGDSKYIDQDQFQSATPSYQYVATGGYVVECIERESKKKGRYCSILLESNYEFLWVSIFPDHYKKLVEKGINFVNSQGAIMLLSGLLKHDDFKKEQVLKVWDSSEIVILGV